MVAVALVACSVPRAVAVTAEDAATPAGAQAVPAATSAPPPKPLVEKIEVRGEAEEVAIRDTTAFATVIRADEFANRVTSVSQLLREAVGVQVRDLGGEFATVSIRGSTAEQVTVYLDGVPLNRALGGGVNLADLPLAQIESIEVYRGFTPAMLSGASIGGAILIHSRAATAGVRQAAGSIAYGAFGTGELVASVSGRGTRGSYAVGADGARSQADFTFVDDNSTNVTTSDDAIATRVNNDFTRAHLSGQGTLQAGARTRLTFTTDLFHREQGVPGLGTAQSTSARLSTSRGLLRIESETAGLAAGSLLLRAAADYARQSEAFDDPLGTIALPQSTDNRIASAGGEFGGVLAATPHQAVSFLLAERRETADLANLELDPAGLGRAARTTLVATLEDQWSLAGDALVINPSLRHERYGTSFDPGPATGTVPDAFVSDGAHTTGKIGFRARLDERLSLKGNVGSFLRLPQFIELFGNRGSVLGNPLLQPERGDSADLGILYERRRTAGTLRQARFETTAFLTRADNLILFQPNPQNTVIALNTGGAEVRGVELSLALALGARFTGSLNATLQRAVNRSGSFADGYLLPGRPAEELSAAAGLDLGRTQLTYNLTWVGKNYTDQTNTESEALPRRVLHDVAASVRLPRGLQGTIEITNIADDRIVDVARFPLPGRSVIGRLSWAF
jgi:iron complex outermembrane receptor protein